MSLSNGSFSALKSLKHGAYHAVESAWTDRARMPCALSLMQVWQAACFWIDKIREGRCFMKRTGTHARRIALLLCLCMIMSMIQLPVFAVPVEEEYPYQYPDNSSYPYYEISMYAYKLNESDEGAYATPIMRLLDTKNGNQAILAYCADSAIFDEYGFRYKAVDLESLTTTSANAGKLRAVICNTYPFLTQQEMIARIKESGITLHDDVIPHYEMVLISAVQQAIYFYTNPELTIEEPFAGAIPLRDYNTYYRSLAYQPLENYDRDKIYYDGLYPSIEEDVKAIIEWLKSLPEVASSAPDTSFTAEIAAAGGGSHTLTLTLSDEMQQAETLTATVTAGETIVWEDHVIPGADNTCLITLPAGSIQAGATVSVVLSGTIDCPDVIAYESETNDAIQSQPLIGWGNLAKPFTSNAVVAQPSSDVIRIVPADITIYMGGESGYDAVVDNTDNITGTNSLPRPLFYLEAPDGVDPAQLIFTSSDFVPGTQDRKEWTVEKAGEDRDGTALYYLNKVLEAQDEVRVQYSIGENVFTNDQFVPSVIHELYEDYTIELYTNTVNPDQITASVKGDTKVYGLVLGTGTLRVRAVENGNQTPDSNPVSIMQAAAPEEPLASESAAVTAPMGTQYVLNHTTVDVPAAGVGLLFDDIYDKDNGQNLRENALIAGADRVIGPAGSNVERFHQAKYLDLVDENNGNAWVKTTGAAVTVYWGYPEGTDSSTSFTLLHFKNLHRDDADGAASGYTVTDIEQVTPEIVPITLDEAGIQFSVESGGFSPFVLVWETTDTPSTPHRPSSNGGSGSPGTPLDPAGGSQEEPPVQSETPAESTPPAAPSAPSETPESAPPAQSQPSVSSAEPQPEKPIDSVPQTGDPAYPLILLPLCALSGTAILLINRKRIQAALHK